MNRSVQDDIANTVVSRPSKSGVPSKYSRNALDINRSVVLESLSHERHGIEPSI